MEKNFEEALKRNEENTLKRSRTVTDLENRFRWHTPKDLATGEKHGIIRDKCFNLALIIIDTVPPGREQALALTHLEEVMMWGNAGIARNG